MLLRRFLLGTVSLVTGIGSLYYYMRGEDSGILPYVAVASGALVGLDYLLSGRGSRSNSRSKRGVDSGDDDDWHSPTPYQRHDPGEPPAAAAAVMRTRKRDYDLPAQQHKKPREERLLEVLIER